MKLHEVMNLMDWGMKVNVVTYDDEGFATDSTIENHLYDVGDVVNSSEVWPVLKYMTATSIWYSVVSERVIIEVTEEEEEL